MFKKLKKLLFRYYMKAVTDKGTPEYIARGWGIGMFVGFVMPFGAQLVVSIPLAFLLKGSKIGSIVGTFVTNHVTIFFIYPVQCWFGNKLIGGDLSLAYIQEKLSDVFVRQDYEALFALGKEFVFSFFAGGLLFAVISTPICYYAVKTIVIRYRKMREKKKLAAIAGKPAAEQQRGRL